MIASVSSYSYSELVSAGRLKQVEVPSKAKEMGFECIEFSTLTLEPGETREAAARALRIECDRVGLRVVNYAVSADFLGGSGGDWKAEAKRLESELKVALLLGSPSMRHDATSGFARTHRGPRDFASALPALAGGCRLVAEMAAGMGLRTMVENHGFYSQDSERMERLFCSVDHPAFGLLVDVGNFLCVDEAPEKAVGLLAPYAVHVHVKDFHVKPGTAADPGAGWFRSRAGNHLRGAVLGHGDVPVAQCLRLLKDKGYDGPVSIEFEGMEDPLVGISVGRDNLLRILARL